MDAARLPSDLAAACHASAVLLAQHGQALQQVLTGLQAVLAQAAKAAEVPKPDSHCSLTTSGEQEKKEDEPLEVVVEPSHGGDTGKGSKQAGQPCETTDAAEATPTVSSQGNGCDGCVACTPCTPCAPQAQQAQQAQQPQASSACPSCPQQAKGCGKGQRWVPWPKLYDPEPRFDGWTSLEWKEWVSSSCGSRWCYNKKTEADMLADWMIETWGLVNLQRGSGVLDIGGEPGFLAASLLDRGISVTVVDAHWGKTGKSNSHTQLQEAKADGLLSPQLRAICATFDTDFIEEHKDLVENASAIVSLYGDEATTPCLQYAAIAKIPCVVIPCNECVRLYPPHQRNYEGYCQALLSFANDQGGRFQRAALEGAPFSRMLLVQLPDSDEFRQSMDPFAAAEWDGVFGLAQSLSDHVEFNVVQNLLKGGVNMKKPVFAVYLGRRVEDEAEVTFGDYHDSRMASPLHWVNISEEGYWQFQFDDITVDGKPTGLCARHGKRRCQGVLDTGSSLLMGPRSELDTLLELLTFQGGTQMHCAASKRFPKLGFQIGKHAFEMDADDYIDRSGPEQPDGVGNCWAHLMPVGDTGRGAVFVLGMPFLRAFYTVYDVEAKRIGIAKAKHQSKQVTSDSADVKLVSLRPSGNNLQGKAEGRLSNDQDPKVKA
ncbi:PGC [Symbiodinium natans]|uniref:PGC protein n=1 Tax=Symbiodinium natans TaxID=878477 RepID=A0A812QYM6_9DINO|nr:PGC [Symbiodinium natans]